MSTPLPLQVSANNGGALKAWHTYTVPESVTVSSDTVTKLTDCSGNGVDFEPGIAPTYIAESTNLIPGARFNGIDERLKSSVSIDFSTNNAATLIAVFRYTNNPLSVVDKGVVLTQNDTDTDSMIAIANTELYRTDAFDVSTDSYLDVDNDTHIIVVKASSSSGEREIWIDGRLEKTTSITWNNGSGIIGIGRDENGSDDYYTGHILEDQVYDVALTDDEIVALSKDLGKKWAVSVRAVPTDAYFHFDADASSTITLNVGDVSTIDNKGSAAANPTQGTASEQPLYDVGGMNGRSCLTFDETANQDLVGIGQGSTSSSFTVFVVGKIDDEGNHSTYCRNASSNKGWQIRKDRNENIQLRIGDGTMTQTISGQPAGGADAFKIPHIVMGTYSSGSGSIYFNNVLIDTDSDAISFTTPDIIVGDGNLTGSIGEMIFFERVLDQEEIDEVYNYLKDKWINPLITTDLGYYYDLSKPKTLTFNGGDISGIKNIEGTATYDCSQGTASLQPTFNGWLVKQRPGVTVTRSDGEGFSFAAGTLPQPANVTLYLVAEMTTKNNQFRLIIQNRSASSGYRWGFNNNNRMWFTVQTAGGADNLTPSDISFDNDATKPFVACVRYDGATMKMDFRNGETSHSLSKAHGNPGDIIYSSPSNTMFNEGDVDGYISVIASHNVAHDDDTMEENMNYLMRQFNIG